MPERLTFQVDPNNIPLPKPGMYRVTCLINGKPYIGISQNLVQRSEEHANDFKSKHKFARAVRKYGPQNFLFEPLFYWTDKNFDRFWLSQFEALTIIEYDSIKNGYNVIAANGKVGPYGEEFSKLIADWHASKTPEERRQHMRPAIEAMMAVITPERRREQALKYGSEVLAERMIKWQSERTPEERSRIASEAGKASAAAQTPEQRKANSNKARTAYMANTTLEQRQEIAKKTGVGKATKEQLSTWGSKGVEIANNARTPEERSQLASIGARALHASRTPKQRIEIAKKASDASVEKYWLRRLKAVIRKIKSPEEPVLTSSNHDSQETEPNPQLAPDFLDDRPSQAPDD